ncbi:MAG TPA: PKD domain-containing protein [Vicinamibacterales bacterium]|nr:PKD domain-containing protein [Vicinamibacterales bacterium]
MTDRRVRLLAAATLLCSFAVVRVADAQPGEVALHMTNARTVGAWSKVSDPTAADGVRLANPDQGGAKLAASATPVSYFELDFTADAGVPYRLWIRGLAQKNSFSNDSASVQFSDSVTAAGLPQFRIGTTSATIFVLEDCSGCGVKGWGWNDNYYGTAAGDLIYFATSGTHTVRVQVREDGLSIDQIVLSPATYLAAAPGALKNDTVILPESGTVAVVDPAPSDPPPPTPPPTEPPPPTTTGPGEVVLYASQAARFGNWTLVSDATAAGGARVSNPDKGAAKMTTALASPTDYFELPFTASAGVGYRLWIRGRAQNDSYANDSAHVQFSDSLTSAGAPAFRIGSTGSTVYTIEDCSGCGVKGWGWNDNYYGAAPGDLIYFATTGTHTIRVQVREDGLSIDQIVLSPATYLSTAPGALKNDTVILAPADGSGLSTGGDPPPPAVNAPPVIEPGEDGFRIGSLEGAMMAPATLLFSASATGPEATDTLTYAWDFGDGSPVQTYSQTPEASRQNAVHTYLAGGTFTATVTITDQAGNATTASGSVTVAAAAPVDPSAPTLKVMQLNTYKGRSTDTRTEQSKIWLQSRWIAAANPDVVLLQEVMGTTAANKYKAALESALPGTTWSYFFRTDADGDSTSAQGIAIFTRLRIDSTASMAYQPCPAADIVQRAAISAAMTVKGRSITIVNTHLSSYEGAANIACRTAQVQQLLPWAEALGSTRILGGDLNADPQEDAIRLFVAPAYVDTWDDVAHRTSYPDNPSAALITRSERIDYIRTSLGAPLDLLSVQVPDTRDVTNDNPIASQGTSLYEPLNYAPRMSDHETIIATFAVR